jgi:hypothetical protein
MPLLALLHLSGDAETHRHVLSRAGDAQGQPRPRACNPGTICARLRAAARPPVKDEPDSQIFNRWGYLHAFWEKGHSVSRRRSRSRSPTATK